MKTLNPKHQTLNKSKIRNPNALNIGTFDIHTCLVFYYSIFGFTSGGKL